MKAILFAAAVISTLLVSIEASCTYHARLRRNAGLKNTPVSRERRQVTCDSSSPYRSYDGTCNNLNNNEWGSVNSEFLRLLLPVYDDDVGTPRQKATDLSDLPNPRTISNKVHFQLSFPSNRNSPMVMQWGQFIDHDITKTPNVEDEGEEIDCCSRTDSVLTDSASPCFPIHVPDGDGYYHNDTCINFVRSDPVSGTAKRQQYNAITAFIDGSMIYGTSEAEMLTLRDSSIGKGMMKVKNEKFLPEGSTSDCFYNATEPEHYCFLAGDARVNAFFGLGAMHTLFLREHNRIATELSALNSAWDDEKVFQETRKIIAAELQIITFRDWLPEILSNEVLTEYNLREGSYNYNISLDPTFSNIFSGAAFRYGHSQVPETFTIGAKVIETGNLFKVTDYVIDSFDDVIISLINASAERADAWYVDGMRNKMFETSDTLRDGEDVVARNIQRGRDHGLPPYNDWREYCGLGRITAFLNNDFGRIQGNDLQEVYASVDDIDIYSGGISEQPQPGGVVGKTYSCLIAKQMEKLRDGDRFWYETSDTTVGFTDDQKAQLNKVSLARIICQNSGIAKIQRNVFLTDSKDLTCSEVVKMAFRHWRE